MPWPSILGMRKMQAGDKKLIGAGFIVLALVLLARKRNEADPGFQRNWEAFGWGRIPTQGANTGSGGLITTGISYCEDCGG